MTRFVRLPSRHARVRTGAVSPSTATAQATVADLRKKIALAKSIGLSAGVIASLQRQFVCAQATLARALGLSAGVIASLDAQCRPTAPVVQSRPIPPPAGPRPTYPAVYQPDVIHPGAGAAARPGDTVRIMTAPVAYEVGGQSQDTGFLFQRGTALHGNAPVSAVDISIQRSAGGNRLHGAAIAWLYANGQYDRPAFQHSWDRPWVDIDRNQIVHVWQNGVLFV